MKAKYHYMKRKTTLGKQTKSERLMKHALAARPTLFVTGLTVWFYLFTFFSFLVPQRLAIYK